MRYRLTDKRKRQDTFHESDSFVDTMAEYDRIKRHELRKGIYERGFYVIEDRDTWHVFYP